MQEGRIFVYLQFRIIRGSALVIFYYMLLTEVTIITHTKTTFQMVPAL